MVDRMERRIDDVYECLYTMGRAVSILFERVREREHEHEHVIPDGQSQ